MIISIPFEKMLFSLPQKRGIWLHILFLILHSALSFRITFNFFPSKRTTKDKNNKVRRITVTEAERLQTLPDGYTDGVSDSKRYAAIGNGWTVDVIAYILSYLKF